MSSMTVMKIKTTAALRAFIKIDNCRGGQVYRKTEMMQAVVAAVVSTANQMKALGTSASTTNLSLKS